MSGPGSRPRSFEALRRLPVVGATLAPSRTGPLAAGLGTAHERGLERPSENQAAGPRGHRQRREHRWEGRLEHDDEAAELASQHEPPHTARGRETDWVADHNTETRDIQPALGARGGPGSVDRGRAGGADRARAP